MQKILFLFCLVLTLILSTQYRILFTNNNVGGFSFFSSAWYTTNAQTTINFSFDIW